MRGPRSIPAKARECDTGSELRRRSPHDRLYFDVDVRTTMHSNRANSETNVPPDCAQHGARSSGCPLPVTANGLVQARMASWWLGGQATGLVTETARREASRTRRSTHDVPRFSTRRPERVG